MLSNFGSVATINYSVSAPQNISVGTTVSTPFGSTTIYTNVLLTNVDNPQNATDANTDNYAQLNTTGVGIVTNTAMASLKVELNGAGKTGNRLCMVVGTGAGLLDLNAVQNVTLTTYDANDNVIESKTGFDLLDVALTGGTTDRSKLSFLASRGFRYVQLTVNSTASVLSNTRMYYAFAEDVPLLSPQSPLPVELTTFTGRWATDAAELSWITASEKNSSQFVVERSLDGESAFQTVGKVAGQGNSSSPHTYAVRDAEAGQQQAAVLYYRLRQVDTDGKESFSPVIIVAVAARGIAPQVGLDPNPATDAQAVQLIFRNLPTTGGIVQVYSEMGQLVSQAPVAASSR